MRVTLDHVEAHDRDDARHHRAPSWQPSSVHSSRNYCTVQPRTKSTTQVLPVIVEALGDIGHRRARCLRFLARRASCRKRGRDGTTYSRFHPSNYLSHHLAGIVTAAVFSDAAHIVEEIALLKTRTSGATRATAAADPIE